MKTIVEPKDSIAKLWGKQRIRDEGTYRMMRYVLRVDYEGNVLLHNTVTGQLVKLDQDETALMDRLPLQYCHEMDQLIDSHYLVSEQYDEHQRVVKMREILHRFDSISYSPATPITNYTILPTTACNARCYYCYEQGLPIVTMTEKTADDTVRFISEHCGVKKEVSIRWFGGEPIVAAHRIDQICMGLQSRDIHYTTTMTSNGYLFDEQMAVKSKELWHLKHLMISVDGTEKHYNEIKAYVNAADNPYQRVLRNIGLLLDQGISVALRMNFDVGNYQDFQDLLTEAKERYQGNKLLQMYAFPIKGEYPDHNGEILHGSELWFDEKVARLNDSARLAGMFQRVMPLPSLFYSVCKAGDLTSMVIGPSGELGRCTSIFSREDQIVGNVADGTVQYERYECWRIFADPERCSECVFFPNCVLIMKCPGIDRCFLRETRRQCEENVKMTYDRWVSNQSERRNGNDFRGTQGGVYSDCSQ